SRVAENQGGWADVANGPKKGVRPGYRDPIGSSPGALYSTNLQKAQARRTRGKAGHGRARTSTTVGPGIFDWRCCNMRMRVDCVPPGRMNLSHSDLIS